MQPTKTRKVIAIALGVITYMSLNTIFNLLFDKNGLKDALLQALISTVFSGLILWGLLTVLKKFKKTV